jgi:hypothetical protein
MAKMSFGGPGEKGESRPGEEPEQALDEEEKERHRSQAPCPLPQTLRIVLR